MNFSSQSSNDYAFKELSSLTGVKPYVLRFWESEFEEISPSLREDGSKAYSEKDRESVERIKDLLFGQKLSIQEAKGMLQTALKEKEVELEASHEAETSDQINENLETGEGSNSNDRAFSFESSFELMRKSMGLEIVKDENTTKSGLNIDYTEKDMLSLLHAKRKLKISLNKIEELCARYNW
tara:strand:- start:10808 stop:11353 length:546 start_codon:yes stop_codon:yes gene_type:complete